jgi:hypothetical protein
MSMGTLIFSDIGFALVMVIVVFWCFSWSVIGAVVAGFVDVETKSGLIHGLLLGPAGVLVLLLSATEARKHGRKWNVDSEIAIGNVPVHDSNSGSSEYS